MTADSKKTKGAVGNKSGSNREAGLLVGFVLILGMAAIITPSLFQIDSLHAMLRNYAVFAILAIGMMAVILTGGIDLSIGSTLAFSGIIAIQIMAAGLPPIVCILGAIGIGALCGFFNGLLIGKLNVLPLIATLSSMYIIRGIAYIVSGGAWIMPHHFTPEFTAVALGTPLAIHNILLIYVVVFILALIFFSRIKLGRRIYAVGSNEESAKIAGINIGNVKLAVYVLMGALAGLGGFLYVANYSVWEPATGTSIEMEVIAICILGGVSITGGVGRPLGILISTLMMSVMSYFLSMLPGMSVWKMAIQGAIIIIAVTINVMTARLAKARALKAREL